MNLKKIGDFGEKIACFYIKNKGYRILEKNFKKKLNQDINFGEIDIIAEKNNIIRFIEVKTLTNNNNISPEQRVDFAKQRKLKKLAQIWLNQNKISFNAKSQIDIISVRIDLSLNKAKIRYFENAV